MAMKQFHPISAARRQKGVGMIDAMIATLLVIILGLGPLYVIVKASVAQRTAGGQQWVAGQLRSLLLSTAHEAICDTSGNVTASWANPRTITAEELVSDGGPVPSITLVVTALCYAPGAITVNGVNVARSTVTLVGCASGPLASMGPIIIREGEVADNEPTSCSNS